MLLPLIHTPQSITFEANNQIKHSSKRLKKNQIATQKCQINFFSNRFLRIALHCILRTCKWYLFKHTKNQEIPIFFSCFSSFFSCYLSSWLASIELSFMGWLDCSFCFVFHFSMVYVSNEYQFAWRITIKGNRNVFHMKTQTHFASHTIPNRCCCSIKLSNSFDFRLKWYSLFPSNCFILFFSLERWFFPFLSYVLLLGVDRHMGRYQ